MTYPLGAIIETFPLFRGAEVIQHQIDDREQHRLLDAERKDQETQSMLRYLERLQQEDMDNLTKKRQAQQQLMDEVAKCNEVWTCVASDPGQLTVVCGLVPHVSYRFLLFEIFMYYAGDTLFFVSYNRIPRPPDHTNLCGFCYNTVLHVYRRYTSSPIPCIILRDFTRYFMYLCRRYSVRRCFNESRRSLRTSA